MLIVPKASVRTNLTIAILLAIFLSWIISSGVANYFNYLSFRSLRQEMMNQPDASSRPIPAPKFGIIEFLTGRPGIPKGHGNHDRQVPPSQIRNPDPHPEVERDQPPPRTKTAFFEIRNLLMRILVAFGLAALAGAWLARSFTKPLTQLAKGADAYQAGDFSHRIPAKGKNEFAAVAGAMNEMAEQVSDQISRLESDAQRRKQFLADIAHELRSPVTTMETMAGALRDGLAQDPDRKDFAVSALVSTSQRMRRLVQDLMELAKLDLTELPLNMTRVDLKDIVSSSMQSHEVEAEAASVVLEPLSSTGTANVVADPDRLAQVVNNILENAIDYAGEGSKISISIKDSDPAIIEISDTGKGIPSNVIPYVLDPFYRADTARTPNDCHSGLGLSIASRLVEAHGGKLSLTSKEGKGTTVTISIPKNKQIDH
jgi:signal transduction histidine kinase